MQTLRQQTVSVDVMKRIGPELENPQRHIGTVTSDGVLGANYFNLGEPKDSEPQSRAFSHVT